MKNTIPFLKNAWYHIRNATIKTATAIKYVWQKYDIGTKLGMTLLGVWMVLKFVATVVGVVFVFIVLVMKFLLSIGDKD